MKKIIPLIIAICFAGSAFAASEKTVAVVNNEAIFESDFNEELNPIMERFKTSVPAAEQTSERIKEIEDLVLSQKIDEVLILQEIKKQNIKVTKKEIQDEVKNLSDSFASEAEFRAQLEKEGISRSKLEKQIEERIAANKLLRQAVGAKIKQPTDSEAKAFYDKIIRKMKNTNSKIGSTDEEEELLSYFALQVKRVVGEKASVRQVFVSAPKNASSSDLKKAETKVSNVKKALRDGKSFSEVAAQYSDDPNAKSTGGSLGVIAKGDLVAPADKAVFALNVGQYTKEPVKTDTGYHFFKVEEKSAARDSEVTFDELKNQIKTVLAQNNERQETLNYLNSLRTKANIKINR